MFADQCHCVLRIVVFAKNCGIRCIVLTYPIRINEYAAMIRTIKCHDVSFAGTGSCRCDRHQIGLRTRINKTKSLYRCETFTQQRRQLLFITIGTTQQNAVGHCPLHGVVNLRARMAKKPGCILADKISIGMSVDIGECCTAPAGNSQGKRVKVQHRTGVAARH